MSPTFNNRFAPLQGDNLVVYLYRFNKFECLFCLIKDKAAFCRDFHAIFGKIVRNVSEKVLFALIKSKYLPVLL